MSLSQYKSDDLRTEAAQDKQAMQDQLDKSTLLAHAGAYNDLVELPEQFADTATKQAVKGKVIGLFQLTTALMTKGHEHILNGGSVAELGNGIAAPVTPELSPAPAPATNGSNPLTKGESDAVQQMKRIFPNLEEAALFIDNHSAKLKEKDSLIEELTEQVRLSEETDNATEAELQGKLDEAMAEIQQLKEAISTGNTVRKTLQEQLGATDQEMAAVRHQLEDALTSLQRVEASEEELRHQVQVAEQKVTELTSSNDELTTNLDAYKDAFEKNKASLETAIAQINEANGKNATLETELNEALRVKNNAEASLHAMTQARDSLQRQLDDLSGQQPTTVAPAIDWELRAKADGFDAILPYVEMFDDSRTNKALKRARTATAKNIPWDKLPQRAFELMDEADEANKHRGGND